MEKGWITGVFSNITVKSMIFAAVIGVLCALFQFFVQLETAKSRSAAGIAMLMQSLEKPAARAVLILDAELAQDIATGVTGHDFITAAQILEDHNVVLGEATRTEQVPHSSFERLIATFSDMKSQIVRPLHLPASMSDATGEIRLTIDGPRAIASAMNSICVTLMATFFLVTFVLLVAFSLLPPREGN